MLAIDVADMAARRSENLRPRLVERFSLKHSGAFETPRETSDTPKSRLYSRLHD
jgi:hypothetical protein